MAGEALFTSIPAGWEATTLGDILKRGGGHVQTGPFGSQLHASDYVSVGIPSIMPVNIGERRIIEDGICRITEADAHRLSRHRVRSGDIIYSRRGDVERCALVRPEQEGWLCGTGCLQVRLGDDRLNPRFASFYLSHPEVRGWILRHAVGATMPNLNTSIMQAIPFLIPPSLEQKAIAHILGTLDDKIELNRRMNQTLEEMARALFRSWFVDFDPVRAKAEGRETGLPEEIAALFPDEFEDSELGEIPKGWKVTPLSNQLNIIGGGTPKTSVAEYWNGNIPWFSVTDTPAGSDVFVIATERTITEAGLLNSSARLVSKGTTIISARGTVGNLAITGCDMAFNQSCYGLKGIDNTGYYYVYLLALLMVERLKNMAHGSVFSTITRQTFEAIVRPLPCYTTLRAFEQMVSPLFGAILSNVEQSRTFASIRDTLLPKLISGELRIEDAERFTEASGA